MRSNGERIYQGLMGREAMEKLEEENVPPKEEDFRFELPDYNLCSLVKQLLAEEEEPVSREVPS